MSENHSSTENRGEKSNLQFQCMNFRKFFDRCDGIFLNFHWTKDSLANSFSVASKKNRLHDVYVGLDVFGRGCPGGGGFYSADVN